MNMVYVYIYFFLHWFLSAMFCKFQCVALAYILIKSIPKYVMFGATVNDIILISFCSCSLLVYGNTSFIFYPVTFLNSLISRNSFFIYRFFLECLISWSRCLRINPVLILFQYVCILFFLCCFILARTSSTMLNTHDESSHPYLFPNFVQTFH